MMSSSVKQILIIISLFLLQSCEKTTDLSESKAAQDRFIGKYFCTQTNLFVYKYIPSSNFYDSNHADYYLATYIGSPEETLSDHVEWLSEGTALEKIEKVFLIDKGSKIKIEKIFYYKNPLCCRYFAPLGSLDNFESKLVDLRNIFNETYFVESPFSGYGLDSDLDVGHRYIKYCE